MSTGSFHHASGAIPPCHLGHSTMSAELFHHASWVIPPYQLCNSTMPAEPFHHVSWAIPPCQLSHSTTSHRSIFRRSARLLAGRPDDDGGRAGLHPGQLVVRRHLQSDRPHQYTHHLLLRLPDPLRRILLHQVSVHIPMQAVNVHPASVRSRRVMRRLNVHLLVEMTSISVT